MAEAATQVVERLTSKYQAWASGLDDELPHYQLHILYLPTLNWVTPDFDLCTYSPSERAGVYVAKNHFCERLDGVLPDAVPNLVFDLSRVWPGKPIGRAVRLPDHGGVAEPQRVVQGSAPEPSPQAARADPPGDAAAVRKGVSDAVRLALLTEAARAANDIDDPESVILGAPVPVFAAAVETLGGAERLGREIRSDSDLLDALVAGFPAGVLQGLRESGWSQDTLDRVIAPRRTLMRRKSLNQRLTRPESDAAWRLAHVLAFAEYVLNGRPAALAWLSRPKPSLGGRTPADVLDTAVGAHQVERLLHNLDTGDVA